MRTPILPLLGLCLPLVASAGFEASSTKKSSRGQESHEASSAIDGMPETAWMIDPEETNEGQWIQIDVPKGKVDKVSLIVGWAKDDESWVDHARVKAAKLEVFDLEAETVVHEQTVSFEDVKTPQVVDLPEPQVGGMFNGGRVKLTVTEVYAGKDYAHLALSEMLVYMEEFEAASRELVGMPSSEDPDHDGSMMIDDSTKTFWAAQGDREGSSFTLDGGKYSVSSLGITAGPKSHGRPKTVEVTQSNTTRTYTLEDTTKVQWVELPALVGYNGSGFGPVTVKITEVYPGSSTSDVAIADVRFKATQLEAF